MHDKSILAIATGISRLAKSAKTTNQLFNSFKVNGVTVNCSAYLRKSGAIVITVSCQGHTGTRVVTDKTQKHLFNAAQSLTRRVLGEYAITLI